MIKSNLFSNLNEDQKFDLIVCNHPYISYDEKIGNVQNYDQHNTLFSDKNGFLIYEKLIFDTKKY